MVYILFLTLMKAVIHISEITNMEKYSNYKEQMGRLKKAMDHHFLLEALFIEYAIMEDRCESLLRHSGVFNPERHDTINKKLNRIADLARNKKALIRKYISAELIEDIKTWKEERNRLIHALMKQNLTGEELERIGFQGQELVKVLCSKTTSYKRALERSHRKEG